MPDQNNIREPQLFQKRFNVAGEVFRGKPFGWMIGPSVATQCNGINPVFRRQMRQHQFKGVPGIARAVQKDNRPARRISLDNVIQR